jgi:hypothetical protein
VTTLGGMMDNFIREVHHIKVRTSQVTMDDSVFPPVVTEAFVNEGVEERLAIRWVYVSAKGYLIPVQEGEAVKLLEDAYQRRHDAKV